MLCTCDEVIGGEMETLLGIFQVALPCNLNCFYEGKIDSEGG